MIVSASYKTDIPAFYGAWFERRLAAGFCRMVNPWGGQVHTVALTPEAVDGFVFWTRNLRPFAPQLAAICAQYPFIVHYTITGYPRAVEASVVPPSRAIEDVHAAAAEFGPRVAVWRYDPILLSTLTTADWHRRNFAALAAGLAGAVDEVVVSFTNFYRKTRRNLAAAAKRHEFAWHDPTLDEKRALIGELAAIAAACGMRLTLCAQPDLEGDGVTAARCIDAGRLSELAGRNLIVATKGNRPGCACAASRDIGAYDSCPHGCAYCYAVHDRATAKRVHAAHDPGGEFLIAPAAAHS